MFPRENRRDSLRLEMDQALLTPENYKKGFLIDEELLAGVSASTESGREKFLAFVLRHTTGEYLGYQEFEDLSLALQAINRVERSWNYEKTQASCGDGDCGTGACGTDACPKGFCAPNSSCH